MSEPPDAEKVVFEMGAESNNSACQFVPVPKEDGFWNKIGPPDVTLPSLSIAAYWEAFNTSINWSTYWNP